MTNQPFYHLRPNKSIDRKLFIQTLIGLNQCWPIAEYQYTGFGSYLFDDFKILHDTLNISKMISLEKDLKEYERAKFNVPYACIDIKNVSSTEYLSELFIEDGDHNIFWLDYVSPAEIGSQIADYATLLKELNSGDIVRITLNANVASLGKTDDPDQLQELRFKKLKERIPDEYFPANTKIEDITTAKYPLVLLKILKKVSINCLDDNPPYSPNFLLPLFSSVYADGQQMLTFTGIVLDSHELEEKVKEVLKGYPHNNFLWEEPCYIEIPPLSIREIVELNKLLPSESAEQQLIENFPFIFSGEKDKAIKSYTTFYKYYPNYHHVNF